MGRLSAIEIHNYRAYRGTFRLELPKGENLLVYGENGAGKSSLFHTLRTFMEAPGLRVIEATPSSPRATRPVKITDDRHRFTSLEPGVKLEFGTRQFEWTKAKDDTNHPMIRSLNKGKGFLDYKALLAVHYVRFGEKQEIDLFHLLVEYLLPHYTYSHRGTERTFKERWDELKTEVKRTWQCSRRNKEPQKDFLADLAEFNEAFAKAISGLAKRASTMLTVFGDEFQVDLRFENAEFKKGPKRIEGPRVLALPAFRRLQCPDYHTFLNEARLSALAICLFLAAVKESPAIGLRLLVLDDILIGLDMANRVKVIDLIQDHFKSDGVTNWQFIILTYSKAWFERLKDHLHKPDAAPGWKSVVLWEDRRSEGDKSPYIIAEGSGDLLEMAANHLKRKDYKAAAVYARSALEALCYRTCAKASLFVLHVESPKDRKLEHFWSVLKARISEIVDERRRAQALQLIALLEQAREFVLNRNAHFDVEEEDTLSGEVGAALETVSALTLFLKEQPWQNEYFQSGRQASAVEQMNSHLVAARQLAMKKAARQCQDALKVAFTWFLREYGSKLGVRLPIGVEPSGAAIWKAAKEEKLMPPEALAKLETNKAYLFGCVKGDKFLPEKFEEAAKVLEELCAPRIVTTASPAVASTPSSPGP